MNVNGLNVDAKALGRGVYKLICDAGQEALVAFGMLPKEFVDLFEGQLREKVRAIAAPIKLTKEEEDETVNPIVRAVCSEIYAAAAEQGKMIV